MLHLPSLSNRVGVALVCALCGLGIFASVPALGASPRASARASARAVHPVRIGRAPTLPRGSHVVGSLAAGTPISALVALKPQNGLAAYAQAVSTPGSPDYHQYLTPSEFRTRFGATAAAIAAVEAALRGEGLSPGRVSADGLTIPVTASAGAIGKAFDTSFDGVRLKSGRVAFANTSAPALLSSMSATVQGVVGLDSLSVPEPRSLIRKRTSETGGRHHRNTWATLRTAHVSGGAGPTNSCKPEGTGSYWNADQIASAYGFNGYYAAGDEGAGQTIALVELELNRSSDISAYTTCYGVSPVINYVPVDNGATGSASGSGEAALDIEQIAGLAPAATIDVFQAPNTGTGLLDDYQRMVDTSGVDAISTSWGACEAATGSPFANVEASIFEQAATEGISIYAAAGDSGSSDCYPQTSSATPSVDDPASQPFVTGTGGTSLPADTASSQTTWNDSTQSNGAGGGGISSLWTMPGYQAGAAAGLGVINNLSSGTSCGASAGQYCREVPDVSGNADPRTGYLVYYRGSWSPIGGTSAVAPLWAAYTALVNASPVCNGTPIGFANPLLYAAANNHYATDFTDVTSGTNDYTPDGYTGGLYPARTGYDMVTGLGTPVGTTLGATLCSEADHVALTNPGQQTGDIGAAVHLALSATDAERHQLTFTAAGLPGGIAIDSATGAITGQLPAAAGTYTVTIIATAAATGASTSQTFSWSVKNLAPVVTGLSRHSGGTAGGTSVTITGANLSGATAVRFGSKPAITFAVLGDSQIKATAPSGAGTVYVMVVTPYGTSITGAANAYGYISNAVRFYRCVHTCTLLNTHGARSYRPTRTDYGAYIKVLSSRTASTGGAVTSTRWVGPITASTAGDVGIGSGPRAASAVIIRGSSRKALARVRVLRSHHGTLTLSVRPATHRKTRIWAYLLSGSAVVSGTSVRTLGRSLVRPLRLTIALKRGQTIKLVAVTT